MNIIKNIVPKDKYNIKCPYSMTPSRIVVHNTANDATARNEIAYMISNNQEVSFHYAVDDKEAKMNSKLYRVQVGAFANKANADKLCNELKSKGYSAFVKTE